MAELDDIAKTAPPTEEKKEEKPKLSTLESVVNESIHAVGSATKVGLAAGIPIALGTTTENPIIRRDLGILPGAQIIADYYNRRRRGEKYTAGNLLESSLIGVTRVPVLEKAFSLVNQIATENIGGYVAKTAAWGGLVYPAFILYDEVLSYLIRNRTFKGMWTHMKDKDQGYWATLKKSWKYLFPISLINVFFVPPILQIPVSALLSLGYSFISSRAHRKEGEIPEEKKRDPTPYYKAIPSVLGKLVGNSVRGLYESVYAIGSGLSDSLYKAAPKTSPTPATAPQPA